MGELEERHRATATAYDTVAEAYEDRFVDELGHKPRDRALLDALARRGSGPVVDLGCGPGHIGAHLRDLGRPVIGIDLSPRLAALASKRLDSAVVADATAVPLATSSASDAIAFYSLIHLPRAEELRSAAVSVGLDVVLAERRDPYDNEGHTVRIHLVCELPDTVPPSTSDR